MKHSTILYAVLGALAVVGLVVGIIVVSGNQNDNMPNDPTTDRFPTIEVTPGAHETTLTVPVAAGPTTTEHTSPDDPFDPNDPYGNGDIADDELPDDLGVVVESVEIEDEAPIDAPIEQPSTPPDDAVKEGVKNYDAEPDPEVMPEVINDEIIEKKEEAEEEKRAEEEIKPVTVVSETKAESDLEDKNVRVESETDDTKPEENNGNGPVFINPAKGGANPFENAGDIDIEEHSSDEYTDDGDNKPGEGIHF